MVAVVWSTLLFTNVSSPVASVSCWRGGLHRRHVRVELVVLLARDQLLGHQLPIAPLLHPRVRELRGVALDGSLRLANLGLPLIQRRLGLAQRGLEWPWIDDEEEIAPL